MNRRPFRRMRVLVAPLVIAGLGCGGPPIVSQDLSPGVVLRPDGMPALRARLATAVNSSSAEVMNHTGLAGTLGGARVRLLQSGTHEILLPLPQLADGQVPVCYAINATPESGVVEYRLRQRENDNVVVSLKLQGDRNAEIQIDWSAVVLIAGSSVSANSADPEAYRAPTACAQSGSAEIVKLAGELWPETGGAPAFAANIQRFVRDMKQAHQPRSLDAEGILRSGANGICTANANLALALMRAKGIPSRSMAVVPPNAQKLEMHRVVEYFSDGAWVPFDPSSLRAEIPMQPWHYVIMAKTTVADEQVAMKLRMGAMLGCPYAQELEVLSAGIAPWGQDFFWTTARPLAAFEPTEEAVALAVKSWKGYLETGSLTAGQIRASSARDAAEFMESLRGEQ